MDSVCSKRKHEVVGVAKWLGDRKGIGMQGMGVGTYQKTHRHVQYSQAMKK